MGPYFVIVTPLSMFSTTVLRMRRDIRFEANKTGYISFFRIEANRRILHAKE
jgi:hypothetical protein